MIRVAITGATGFVGQALYKLLSESSNVEVTIIGRHNPQNHLPFINIESESIANIVKQLKNYDAIVHLAARAHSHKSTVEDFKRDNIELTQKLAQIACEVGITQFIYLSSIKVMGNKTVSNKPFRANDIPMPEDDYGKSKWACEQLLISHLSKSSTAYTVIRPPLVWGENVKGNLKTLINLINKRIPLPFKAINNRRDIVSLSNLTRFIEHTLLNPKAFNDTFLVSDGKSLSTEEIIHLLEQFTEKKANIVHCPKFIFDIAKKIPLLQKKIESFSDNLEVDISDTSKKLDWMPLK